VVIGTSRYPCTCMPEYLPTTMTGYDRMSGRWHNLLIMRGSGAREPSRQPTRPMARHRAPRSNPGAASRDHEPYRPLRRTPWAA